MSITSSWISTSWNILNLSRNNLKTTVSVRLHGNGSFWKHFGIYVIYVIYNFLRWSTNFVRSVLLLDFWKIHSPEYPAEPPAALFWCSAVFHFQPNLELFLLQSTEQWWFVLLMNNYIFTKITINMKKDRCVITVHRPNQAVNQNILLCYLLVLSKYFLILLNNFLRQGLKRVHLVWGIRDWTEAFFVFQTAKFWFRVFDYSNTYIYIDLRWFAFHTDSSVLESNSISPEKKCNILLTFAWKSSPTHRGIINNAEIWRKVLILILINIDELSTQIHRSMQIYESQYGCTRNCGSVVASRWISRKLKVAAKVNHL